MEINYRNGFLFGVKLLKKKIVVKRLRLFHNPPQILVLWIIKTSVFKPANRRCEVFKVN